MERAGASGWLGPPEAEAQQGPGQAPSSPWLPALLTQQVWRPRSRGEHPAWTWAVQASWQTLSLWVTRKLLQIQLWAPQCLGATDHESSWLTGLWVARESPFFWALHRVLAWALRTLASVPMGDASAQRSELDGTGWDHGGRYSPIDQRGHPVLWGWGL